MMKNMFMAFILPPKINLKEVDEDMRNLGFLQTDLKREYSAPPNIAYDSLVIEKKELELDIEKIDVEIHAALNERKLNLLRLTKD